MPLALLHTKSHYSLGHGTASPAELVGRAASLGITAMALTDVETLAGQVEFHTACRRHGVKAITGVELRMVSDAFEKKGRLVLLARNLAGYEALCGIVTRRARRASVAEEPASRLAPTDDLAVLSDDADVLRSLVSRGFGRGSLRLFLVRPNDDREREIRAREAAKELGIAPVADIDVVMREPDDRPLHALLTAIRVGTPIATLRTSSVLESGGRSLASVNESFADALEAVSEAAVIAADCDFDLLSFGRVYPSFDGSSDESAFGRLSTLCRRRVRPDRIYRERLEHELDVIRRLGMASYFLVVMEVMEEARRRRIGVSGRGSAAGSLVSHVLEITEADPVAENLFFERFVHEARRDAPDIDVDVASDRRDELVSWALGRFGDRAALISVHQTFGRRSAYRESLKALGMSKAEIERFARAIPDDELELPLPTHLLTEPYRSAAPWIDRLIGKPRNIATHPGGVVVTDRPVIGYSALAHAPKGAAVTHYDAASLDALGLVKLDLLGNRCLAELDEAARLVPELVQIPERDPETMQTIDSARTIGCFQLESPAMRAVLTRLPVRSLSDVVAALALVRPAPGGGDAKDSFIRRAHGEEPPTYAHPALAATLRETYGLILYEEDVMAVIRAMTGVSLSRADELRAAIVHSEDAEAEFSILARAHGFTHAQAAGMWTELVRFAAYSFSKAHASSYALLAYRSAYLKTHAPVVFACAVLNHYGGMYPLRTIASDLRRSGVSVLVPHINRSHIACTIEGSSVRLGLGRLKRITDVTKRRLLAERERNGDFRSVTDFMSRVSLRREELAAFVLSGACDGVAPLVEEEYPFAHERLLGVDPRGRTNATFASPRSRWVYRTLVRIQNELAYLEMHPSAHPMEILRSEADEIGCVSTTELPDHVNETIAFAGVVASARRVSVGRARIMEFLTLEDEKGVAEAVLPAHVYANLEDPVRNPGPYLLSGTVEEDHGHYRIRIQTLEPFYRRPRPHGS
jgi:DNA polymerase III subunit alpha